MENNFPIPIMNDNDLKVYEDYLRKDNPISIEANHKTLLPEYLKSYIGKSVKVELLIGTRLECKIGTLLEVGTDFLVIKLQQNCSTMFIERQSIKYITIIHNKNFKRYNLY